MRSKILFKLDLKPFILENLEKLCEPGHGLVDIGAVANSCINQEFFNKIISNTSISGILLPNKSLKEKFSGIPSSIFGIDVCIRLKINIKSYFY